MTNLGLTDAQAVDDKVNALLAGVRHFKPKCAVCERPLQESVTGTRRRANDQGTEENLCRACFIAEIAENITEHLPG